MAFNDSTEDADFLASASPYWQKMVNTALTIDEKYDLIKQHGIQKDAQLEGYRRGFITLSDNSDNTPDADSGAIIDEETGQKFDFRTTNINNYDAVDYWKDVYGDASKPKGSWNKRRSQPRMVAEMVGKRVEDLTPEDFLNVKNYQHEQWISALTNPNHQFEKYDKFRTYNGVKFDADTRIPVLYKVNGTDYYNRSLVDLVSDANGRSVTFDAMQNPYLNVTNADYTSPNQEFDVYRALNTSENQKRLAELRSTEGKPITAFQREGSSKYTVEAALDRAETLAAQRDTDGRFGEDIDMVQSTLYQMAARVLKHIPGADKEYWSKIADAENGQRWADLITGVSKETRDTFASNTQKISDLIESGDYVGAAKETFFNLDRFIAESLPQTGLMLAGDIATSGLTALGRAGRALIAALPAGFDKALTDAEEFKKNNGRSMSPLEFARTLVVTTGTLVPEQLLLGMFTGKAKDLFSQVMNKALGRSTTKAATTTTGKILADAGKTVGIATIGEGAQEALETATDNWLSEDQSKHTNLIDDAIRHIASTDTKAAALIGSIMGGTLSAAGGSLATPINIRNNTQRKAVLDALVKHNTETNVLGQKADIEASEEAIKTVDAMSVDSNATDEQKIQAIRDLQQQSVNPSLNVDAVKAIQRKQHELATDLVRSLQKLESAEAKEKAQEAFFKAMQDANITSLGSREALFGQLTYYSNYNARELFEQGNVASTEAREEAKKELLETAKDLGIDEKTALKTLEEVGKDVKYGPRGYYSYADKLHALIDSSRGNPNLSQGDKTKIQNEIDNTATRLVALLANQQNKLGDLVQAAETIAEGTKRDVPVTYRSGEGKFEVIGSQLANNAIDSDVGIYRLIKDLTTDIESMQKILGDSTLLSPGKLQEIASEYNRKENMKSPYESRQYGDSKATANILARFRNAVTTIQKETKERYAKPKEGILGRFSSRGKQVTPQKAAAMLDRLARGANESATTQLTQQIRNYLEYGSLEDLNKAIDSYYSKSKDKKEKVLAKLKEIQNLDTANKEAVSTREVKNNDVFNRVNQELDGITSESIKKLTLEDGKKIDEIANTLTRLRREFKEVMTNSEQDKALLNRINKLATELQERNVELGKENLRKHAGELNKKATELNGVRPHFIRTEGTTGAIAGTSEEGAVLIYTDSKGRPILKTFRDFMKYITGKASSETSKQKQIVFERLKAKGYDEKFFKDNLKTVNDIYDLIIFHEKSHIRHNDASCYFDNDKDLLTEDKIAIETRATEEAIKEFLLSKKKEEASKPTDNSPIENNEVPKPTKTTSGYTLHSGGAKGSDTIWGEIGAEYGITSNHYYYSEKTPNGNIALSDEQYKEGIVKAKEAAKALGRAWSSKPYIQHLVARNWYQVKNADAVFAIASNFETNTKTGKEQLTGGTAYAVQMAITENLKANKVLRPIYVFNQKTGSWYEYDNYLQEFKAINYTPALTKNFAGIGTRDITDAGKQAIRDVYEKTFGTTRETPKVESKPIETVKKSAIESDPLFIPFDKTIKGENTPHTVNQTKLKYKEQLIFLQKLIGDIRNKKDIDPNRVDLALNICVKLERLATSASDEVRGARSFSDYILRQQDIIEKYSIKELDKDVRSISCNFDYYEYDYKHNIDFLLSYTFNNKKSDEAYNRILYNTTHIFDLIKEEDLVTTEDKAIYAKNKQKRDAAIAEVNKIFNRTSESSTATVNDSQTSTPDMASDTENQVSSESSIQDTSSDEKSKVSEESEVEDTESTEIIPDKKSPVSGLLNNEINKSVDLFKDDPNRIDLNQQLRIGNADSKLAIDSTLYDNEFTKPNYGLSLSPKDIFKKIKLPFSGIGVDKVAAYNNFYKYHYRDMPQMLLLYNIVTGERKTKNSGTLKTIESIEYNEIVCKAIDFSTKEYFSSSLYKNLYRPDTLPDERVCSIFHYNEATITPKELRQLKKFIKEYGVPRAYIADMLGLTILRNLGIRHNDKTGDWGFYEKIATGLGLQALRYAEELGVVTNNEYNVKKNAKYDVINADLVRCIQISEANQNRINRISSIFNTRKDKQTGEKITGLIEIMKPDSDTRIDKGIRWGKPRRLSYKDKEGNIVDIPVYIKNTDDLVEVPPQARETLQALHRQKFSLNRELIDILVQNRKAIEKKLGWKDSQEIEDLYFSRQSGQEAANQSIVEQLDALVDAAKEYDRRVEEGSLDKKRGGIYFNWYMSRNGRYFIDSTDINPQTQKFQRFLLMPSRVYRDFNPLNEEHNELEAFAIVQAFDNVKHSNEEIAEIAKKVNALSLEELEQIQKDLLDPNLSEKAFGKKYKEIGLKGVENLAQCLNVLQHLKAKKKANGVIFKTWLAVENDSTTSGYAIRFANMPLKSQYKTMAKTGILVGDMLDKYAGKQIHEMKADKDDFHDLYEDTALDISHRIAEFHPKQIGVVKEYFLEFLKKEKINRSKDTLDGLAQIWTNMYEALPRANEDGTVTGALRLLMKAPTMVFGYGGGIKGISENMSYEIMDEFVQTYVDVMKAGSVAEYLKNNPDADKAKIESIVRTMNGIGKYFVNRKGEELTFLEALKSKDIDRIWVRIGITNMTVEQLFYNIIRPTYGTAVDEALDVKFKEYKAINDTMSQAFVTMFQLFNDTLNAEIDKVLGEEGRITIAARNELIKSLKDLWPSMPTAYGATAEDGIMLLMKSKKMPYNSAYGINRVKNFYFDKSDGKFKQETAYANMRVFDNTSRAGAVVPIHWLDGTIMSSVLKYHLDQGITPIHDALVMSALAAGNATRTMNYMILKLNRDYDLLGTIQNRLFEVIKSYIQLNDKDINLDSIKGLPDLIKDTTLIKDKVIELSEDTAVIYSNILDTGIRDNKGRVKYKYVDGEKVEITLREFLETLYNQYEYVKAARDEFYSQLVGITNVDGPRNTQIVVKPDESMATRAKEVVEEAVPEWKNDTTLPAITTAIRQRTPTVEGDLEEDYGSDDWAINRTPVGYEFVGTSGGVALYYNRKTGEVTHDYFNAWYDWDFFDPQQPKSKTITKENNSKLFSELENSPIRLTENHGEDGNSIYVSPDTEGWWYIRDEDENTGEVSYSELEEDGNILLHKLWKKLHPIGTIDTTATDNSKPLEISTNTSNDDDFTFDTAAVMSDFYNAIREVGSNGHKLDAVIKATRKLSLDILSTYKTKQSIIEFTNGEVDKLRAFRDSLGSIIYNLEGFVAHGLNNDDNDIALIKRLKNKNNHLRKIIKELGLVDEVYNSSYRGYQTDEDIKETSEKIVTDVTARADFVEDLHNMSVKDGGLTCSNEHINRLKSIITKVNPKELVNLVVQLTKDGKLPTGPNNAGSLDIKGDKFIVKLAKDNGFNNVDPITRQSVYSSMSMAEIYTHEVVHAGLHFAFQQHLNNNLKFNSEINQLLDLQRAAMGIITPMDFMPENYDKSLEDVYRKHAEATWNYIFKNENRNTLEGLKEFCAYGLTDERIVNKLKTVRVPEKETKFRNAADKLLHIIKGIFDLIFRNKPIRDVFPLAHSIIRGNTSLRNRSIYAELENLTYKMSNADAKAARSLTMQLAKPFEQVCKAASIVQEFGNKYVGKALDYVFNVADRKEWNRVTKYAQKIGDSRWDDAKLVASSLGLFLVSGHRRRVLKEWLTSVLNLSQQGAAMSIMNDILAPDMQTMRLDMLAMFYRTVDAAAKSQEAICYKELVEAFGGKLNELEETSLTRVGLMTDLQCLLDEDTSVSDVIKLVADDEARLEKIAEIKAILGKNKDYHWIIGQVGSLALYMIEGIGHEHLNLNSYNIARGMLSSTKVNISEKERVLIDKLTTLYALDLLDSDHKKVFSSLKKEGIETFLTTHKGFVKETLGGVKLDDGSIVHTVDQIHTIKGYTKALFDTSYDVQIGFLEDRKDFESRGYELVTELPHNKITDVHEQVLYRRNWANPERRDGAAYKIVGANAIGTSLKDTAYSVYDKIEPEHESLKPKDVWDTFYKRATKNGQRIERLMRKKELDIDEIRKLSGGYTPIMSPTGIPHDYRITMTYENKVKVLGMDTRGMTILSKMFATQHLKATAPAINKALTSFLVTNMEQNMNQYHKDINTGVKYVKIERNSPNEYLRNAWNVIPKELKDVAEDLPNGLWVRDDWLQSLFGVQNYSITEALPKDSFTKTKRMLSIAEYAMKTITYMVKRNIVLLIPRVLFGNIVSNANYSIMTGSNPVSVIRTTLANFRAIRDYMETKRELERIKFRERLGQATDKEIRSKNWLMTKLERNRVHPLMQKGMYQAIVEDINPDELESIGKVMKFLKNWKIADKIPSSAKWILKNLYMTEGTFIHDLMFTLTQYSDFAARATEYQLKLGKMTEGIPRYLDNGKENPKWREKEEALSMMIVRAFINYDKPQSRGEQYLNDMGLMMFTKFAKRIQSVVMHQLTKNPMGVLMFLGAQSMFLDTEDIIEQNALNKHWSALLHNPLANFIDATVPMPIQYYLGMRNL